MNLVRSVWGVGIVVLALAAGLSAQPLSLLAPDGTTVLVARDAWGVPHITAESETGVFFAQGFAVAEDRLFQLETFRRTAEGRISEWFGSAFLPLDREARQMMYTPAERTAAFAALPFELREMFEAYTAGINTYRDSMTVNPARYVPQEFLLYAMEPWTVEKSIAIAQFTTGAFGQFGGFELTRLAELQAYGQAWFEQNRPINDPAAPATIHGPVIFAVRAPRYTGPAVRTAVADALVSERETWRRLAFRVGLPPKFGSFAVLLGPEKTSSGNPMLLGAPQMGAPQLGQTSTIHEVELDCPTLHVGGMALAGIPGVIIGRNEHLTWSLTSGYSDNSDLFIDSTETAAYDRYWHNGQWLPFETFVDTIYVNSAPTVFIHHRTVHGPVVGADLAARQAYSLRMSFRGEELNMARASYAMSRAQTFAEFEQALALNPMSFNVFCATDEGCTGYWHIGRYPVRAASADPRLPVRGDGSQEWQGFVPFASLPRATNTEQSAFCNWNNKPAPWWNQGDNMPWLGGDRVTAIENYVTTIPTLTFAQLADVPHVIADHGTYQQVLEVSSAGWRSESVAPPGQSAFVDMYGVPSPHTADQWPLHLDWEFKDMLFGEPISVAPPVVISQPHEKGFSGSYPNPFNPRTTLRYVLPKSERVRLAVYDVQGRLVRTLADGTMRAGEHEVPFDASGLASGLYFARLAADDFNQSQKLLLLK